MQDTQKTIVTLASIAAVVTLIISGRQSPAPAGPTDPEIPQKVQGLIADMRNAAQAIQQLGSAVMYLNTNFETRIRTVEGRAISTNAPIELSITASTNKPATTNK